MSGGGLTRVELFFGTFVEKLFFFLIIIINILAVSFVGWLRGVYVVVRNVILGMSL